MYKILPILLFTSLLAAAESDADTIWNDNNSKISKGIKYFNQLDISAQNKLFEEIIVKKITQLINQELFHLSVKFNSRASGEFSWQMSFYDDGTVKPSKITSDLTSKQVDVRVYIDKSLNRFEEIWAAAGHPFCVYKCTYNDLISHSKGIESDFISV